MGGVLYGVEAVVGLIIGVLVIVGFSAAMWDLGLNALRDFGIRRGWWQRP